MTLDSEYHKSLREVRRCIDEAFPIPSEARVRQRLGADTSRLDHDHLILISSTEFLAPDEWIEFYGIFMNDLLTAQSTSCCEEEDVDEYLYVERCFDAIMPQYPTYMRSTLPEDERIEDDRREELLYGMSAARCDAICRWLEHLKQYQPLVNESFSFGEAWRLWFGEESPDYWWNL